MFPKLKRPADAGLLLFSLIDAYASMIALKIALGRITDATFDGSAW